MRHNLDSYLDGRSRIEFCRSCSCEQGEMPTDCPGYTISPRDKAMITQGEKDYAQGQWKLLDSSKSAD
jgi:hypothetical protein